VEKSANILRKEMAGEVAEKWWRKDGGNGIEQAGV
jgi:hypothetical protein